MSNPISPFLTLDLHRTYSLEYLEISDIAHASQVCKEWKLVFSDQDLWKALLKKEGIPFVRRANGELLDYRKTFQVLYPITIGSRTISQYIGGVEEQIPDISEDRFNALNQPDPYEKGKLKRETWVVVVVPSYVLRTTSQEVPLVLDKAGNVKVKKKQVAAIKKKQLKVPLSLQNLKVLCSYPLKGKENMPVFSSDSIQEVFKRCTLSTGKINIYFMRRCIVEESRGKPYTEQKQLLNNHGDEVISLGPRAFFNAVSILRKRNCPNNDGLTQKTFVRHPDTISDGLNTYHSFSGGFKPFFGMTVFILDNDVHECDHGAFGVVPGGLAEVPAIDN
jgi:hypothetical protein